MELLTGEKAQIRNILLDPFYDLIGAALHQLDTDAGIGLLELMKYGRKPAYGDTLKGGDGQGSGLYAVDLIDVLFKSLIHGQDGPDQRQNFLRIFGEFYPLIGADEERKAHFFLQRFQNMTDTGLGISQAITALGKITGFRHVGEEFKFFYIHSKPPLCRQRKKASEQYALTPSFYVCKYIRALPKCQMIRILLYRYRMFVIISKV